MPPRYKRDAVRVLPRVVAVLIAVVAYVVLWQLALMAVLLLSVAFGFHVPGYHEPGGYGWWSWLFLVLWFGGLVAVVWWVGIQRPRSRRLSDSAATA